MNLSEHWVRDEEAEQRILGYCYAYRVTRADAEALQGVDRVKYARAAEAVQFCVESILGAIMALPLPPKKG